MKVTPEQLASSLAEAIAEIRGAAGLRIEPDTELFKTGYVDSFALVELIAWISDRMGIPIGDGDLMPEDFETPRKLWERLAELQ
jgi:acyl carrier protein